MSRTTEVLVMALVLIKRDAMLIVPTEVFMHEVPILQLQFGDDNIEVKTEREVTVDNFDVNEEYERLVRKYDDRAKKEIARKVYGQSPRGLAQALGLPYVAGPRANKLAESMQIVDGEEPDAEPRATIRPPVRSTKAKARDDADAAQTLAAKAPKPKPAKTASKAGGPSARKTKGASA